MSSTREALVEWKKRCGLTSFAHHRVQAVYVKRHVRLGILLLICTTATGTSSFVKLGESQPLVSALIVIFTIVAGVLAGIQTFMDYKALGEKHKASASVWESLRWKAERLLASHPTDIEIKILEDFEKEVAEARKQSPTIENNHWDEAVEAFNPSTIT